MSRPSRKFVLVRRTVAALCLLLLPLAAGPARAADPFEVAGIEVDVTAESAAAARQQAIAGGERKAFETLLDRLVAADARADVEAPDETVLQGLIRDFSIVSEKASAVRYIATMVVRFEADAVRAWLVQQGVPFAATPSDPVVVVPVWQTATTLALWDDPNPWRDAWDAAGASAALVPTVMPEGGLEDVAAVSAEQALAGDTAALQALAERYGAAGALVAHARLVVDTRSGMTVAAVGASRHAAAGRQWQADLTVAAEPGEDLDAMLRRAVGAVLAEAERRWKQAAAVGVGPAAALEIVVPITSLRDWVDVRRRLEEMGVVRDLEVVTLASDSVRAVIHYLGDPEGLAAALAAAGLGLEPRGAEWVLKPPSRDIPGR